jgi:hypothetical protein
MNVSHNSRSNKGRVIRSRHHQPLTGSTILAERYILSRWDVSPSLARAIASLAMLGGR